MSKSRLAMILFLLSEAIFFVFLLIAYINFHPANKQRSVSEDLDIGRTGVFTALLVLSSFTVWRSHVNWTLKRGSRFEVWLIATFLLGGAFVWGQVREYLRLFNHQITISQDPFATSFFTVTGFHGLHVCAGLLLLLLTLIWSRAEARRARRIPVGTLDAVSLYWHFVDIVWIVVFSVVYLWGAS